MRAMDADWERLADMVRRRREALGLTQVQLAERTGLTDTTIGNLEGGRRFKRVPASVPAVEQGLGWAPGSARVVLAGGEPTLIAEVADSMPLDERYRRIESVSPEQLSEAVEDMVYEVFMAGPPGMSFEDYDKARRRAFEVLRSKGIEVAMRNRGASEGPQGEA